jgi:hypothetical protein
MVVEIALLRGPKVESTPLCAIVLFPMPSDRPRQPREPPERFWHAVGLESFSQRYNSAIPEYAFCCSAQPLSMREASAPTQRTQPSTLHLHTSPDNPHFYTQNNCSLPSVFTLFLR